MHVLLSSCFNGSQAGLIAECVMFGFARGLRQTAVKSSYGCLLPLLRCQVVFDYFRPRVLWYLVNL